MRSRKGVLHILAFAAAGLVAALVVVSLVTWAFVVSDVRVEMSLTLDALRRDIEGSHELLARCLDVFEARGRSGVRTATDDDVAALRATLMKACCRNWPDAVDGFLLCFQRDGAEIVSSGSPVAIDGERVSDVIGDSEAVRRHRAGEFFKATVYGDRCLCLMADYGTYRFLVALPMRILYRYCQRPLLAVGLVFLALVVAFTIGALKRASLLERLQGYIEGEKTRQREDLAAARLVQTSALPPPFPTQLAFSVSARMDPAKVVGGDFYDYQALPNGNFFFLVADVAGKGISAAMFMMRAKSVIKQCLAETGDLAKGMTEANAVLAAHNESRLFVTAWVGVLDSRTGRVRYVNAGHNPPFVRRPKDGEIALERVACPPSLVLALLPGVAYPVHELTLTPGDSLFLYTDGVTEAQDASGRFYGEERLMKALGGSEDDCLGQVRADLDAFQGEAEPADDVTMLQLDYSGTPPGTARGFPCNRDIGFVESARFVEEELVRIGCPPAVRTRFLTAYDEVGSNVISYSGAESFTVKVAVEATPSAITLTITDAGQPFNPLDKSAPDLNLSLEKRVAGGFGIFIARQLMDDVIYSRDEGRNVLTLRKLLREPSTRAGSVDTSSR